MKHDDIQAEFLLDWMAKMEYQRRVSDARVINTLIGFIEHMQQSAGPDLQTGNVTILWYDIRQWLHSQILPQLQQFQWSLPTTATPGYHPMGESSAPDDLKRIREELEKQLNIRLAVAKELSEETGCSTSK